MRLRCSLSVFYHSSDFFTTSLFYLYLYSDFLANIKNQNQFDDLYKNYYSSSPASLWYLSSDKIDRYSELRGCNKKSHCPEGQWL